MNKICSKILSSIRNIDKIFIISITNNSIEELDEGYHYVKKEVEIYKNIKKTDINGEIQ